MEKPNEDKPDGLEIISIGALYNGPWDKKFWSCSRGKDRYPYPVGYQAVRTHNGSTYKMEIHDGLKGPLFVINSTDGQSCSGQTPDITWESFQKKGNSRVKMWHGRRSSQKIDGVEFFGFRNPFVQRLLRELVANVNGTAERKLLSSTFCNGASGAEHDIRCSDSCAYTDLLPYLARPQITRKRSRQHKIKNLKPDSGARLKRLQPQGLMYNANSSNSRQGNERNQNDKNSTTSSALDEKYGNCNHPEALPASVGLETAVGGENSSFASQNGLPLESYHYFDAVREDGLLPREDGKLVSLENWKSANTDNNLSTNKELLDRSQYTEIRSFDSLMAIEGKDGQALVLKDCPGITRVDLCVPDSLDLLQDNGSGSTPTSPQKSPHNVKDGLVVAEDLVTELHPEEEIGTSTSNPSSEKSDSDSVGQEIAKSMMTVLLPQALPLLKASWKKKKTMNPSEISLCGAKSEENNENGHFVGVGSTAQMLINKCCAEKEEKLHILSTNLGSVPLNSEHIDSVIPDSFENDKCGCRVSNQIPLYSDIAESDQTTFDKDACTPDNLELLGSVDAQKFSVCHFETSDGKDISYYHEVVMAPSERPPKVDIHLPESALGSLCPGTKVLSGRSKDVCPNYDGNSKCVEICYEEKHLKCAPNCSAGDVNLMGKANSVQVSNEEISVNAGGPRTISPSFSQIPDVVAPLTKKYNDPLSESIICRNFHDGCVPETYVSTGTLLASEICQVSSSDNIPNKKVSFGAEARLGGKPHSSHTDTTLNPDGILYNTAPVISKNQFIFASKDTDTSDFLDPSVSHVEKSQDDVEKKLVEHQNLPESNSSIRMIQKLGTSFCDNNVSDTKEVQAGSYLKSHRNMELNNELEGIVDLVGCYVHPLPVSSVLLSTEGNEIHICVLCGHLVDKERTLFLYKVPVKEQRAGCPSCIGHASIMLPISKDSFGREIAMERSCLQLTPDGQCLVFINNIKTPNCREQKIDCPCSACTSDCCEGNAVKVVQVKPGYVSVVAKLRTSDSVHCVLVCGPNHLVAVEESGELHLWVMNSTWSAQAEEFVLPTYDCISPCIVELKRIPKCNPLIVGHNGFGEFGLWDISKRTLISRFSASGTSVFNFLPISLFCWQRNEPVSSMADVDEQINRIMDATKIWFSEQSENYDFKSLEKEDMAVWLLVSAVSDSDAQQNHQSTDCQTNPVGQWRLALLVKNMVILGTPLDPRAVTIGASAGHGIIGTHDGLVYMWEISTGNKLGTLHYFKGHSVSCISVDDSWSHVMAVADDGGQLLVYLHSQMDFVN